MRAIPSIRALIAAAVGASALAAAGCATYANYPRIESDVALHDLNIAPSPELMRRALVEVIGSDIQRGALSAAGGSWVVNFPEGMQRDRAHGIVGIIEEAVGDTDGSIVGEPGAQGAVMYSVTRVWLRGDSAMVEVIRPVLSRGAAVDDYGRPLDTLAGDTGFQRIEVRMRAGFKPWTIVSVREWTPGLAPVPTVYGWPETTEQSPDEGAGESGDASGDAETNEEAA